MPCLDGKAHDFEHTTSSRHPGSPDSHTIHHPGPVCERKVQEEDGKQSGKQQKSREEEVAKALQVF